MGSSKGSPRRARAAERERQASDLRRAGASYQKIAATLGISREGARKAVMRAMDRARKLATEDAREILERELERLDELQVALWPKARAGVPGSVDRVLRVMERRAKLLGLDAAQRVDVDLDGQTKIVVEYRRAGQDDE